MKIGTKIVDQIIVKAVDGEVVAVISDGEVIEKEGYSVILDEIEGSAEYQNFKNLASQYERNPAGFILSRALEIYSMTEHEDVALRALELIAKATPS